MKTKGLIFLLIALAAGMAAFCVMRWQQGADRAAHGHVMLDAMPELAWLERELNLSAEQLAEVKALHVAYRPKCDAMCRRIGQAHEKIASLAAGNRQLTAEYRAALKEHADIHLECQEEMLNHLYQTAALLREDQAKRYLDEMLPYALDFSHSESVHPHER